MRFHPQAIEGVFVVDAVPHVDQRGAFARTFCTREFEAAGITFTTAQINLSTNPVRHTMRGLHYQDPPNAEAKFVRAVRGRAFDVIVDLRRDSPTHRRWVSVELDSRKMNAVFVPEGCAHGFLTLEDDTDILYQMGRHFMDGHAKGVRWNDPAFAIVWPAPPALISPRDAAYANYGNS